MCPGVKRGSGLDYASGVKSVSTCFGVDERTSIVDTCPAGNQPLSCTRDEETGKTKVEMAAGACAGCLFRKQCPIVNTDEGRCVLEYTDRQRRLAARRREQETKVFKERYAMRSGIESTNSGVKNRLGLGKLPVRGRGSVFRVVWHKLAGWNVLRAAASRKLRAWVAEQVARTLKRRESRPLGRVLVLFCGWMSIEITFPGSLGCRQTVSDPFRRSEPENRPPREQRVLSETSSRVSQHQVDVSRVAIFVRAASGRQRFNILGAWNAVTRELIAVTNTTVVNTDTMCELLRKIADLGLTGPITLVLDNARYQRNAVVQALAADLGLSLLFLPSYSPNLNLIERLWKFMKRRALYGRHHPTFRDFQAAIQEVLDGLSTKYSEQLASLMTLNFQQFDDVLLMPA